MHFKAAPETCDCWFYWCRCEQEASARCHLHFFNSHQRHTFCERVDTKTPNQTTRLLCYSCIRTCCHMCAIHIFRFVVLNNTVGGAGWRFTHSYMHPFIFSCSYPPDGPESPENLSPCIRFSFKARPLARLGGTTVYQLVDIHRERRLINRLSAEENHTCSLNICTHSHYRLLQQDRLSFIG